MREFLKVYGVIIVVIAAIFVVALRYVAPPAPSHLRLAAGAADGYYQIVAKRYRDVLAESGVTVELLQTEGAVDNLNWLAAEDREPTDIALVQGGIGRAMHIEKEHIVALAGLFYEPVWLLVRTGVRANSIAQLKDRRIAVGTDGSGTQLLAEQLLVANDIDPEAARLFKLGSSKSIRALESGDIDAAFIVAAEPSNAMTDLLARGKARVLPFAQADAYHMKFPFLSPVHLPRGAISLATNVPPNDATLVAPTAMLLARDDIHPAIVNLLQRAARDIEGHRQLFAPAGTFPTGRRLDFPLHADAAHYFDRGPSLLFRYLPFWLAVYVERMTVMAIPLITLLPILRLGPPAYRWQVENKIYRWYKDLRRIELAAEIAHDDSERDKLRAELDQIGQRLARIKVSGSYAQALYDVRGHVDFVRDRLGARPAA